MWSEISSLESGLLITATAEEVSELVPRNFPMRRRGRGRRDLTPMGRFFDDWIDQFWSDWPFEAASMGRTDVYEKDGKLVYETELPGVNREDIHIAVEGDELIVSGEKRREEHIEEENYVRMGRQVGKFRRSFPLPDEVEDPKKIGAKYEDGILKIEVPLADSLEKSGRHFEIEVQ